MLYRRPLGRVALDLDDTERAAWLEAAHEVLEVRFTLIDVVPHVHDEDSVDRGGLEARGARAHSLSARVGEPFTLNTRLEPLDHLRLKVERADLTLSSYRA